MGKYKCEQSYWGSTLENLQAPYITGVSHLSWSSEPAGKEHKSHGQNINYSELEKRKRQGTEVK